MNFVDEPEDKEKRKSGKNNQIIFRQKSPISSRKMPFTPCCTPKSVQQIA
jgi:hypothetical protein